MKIVIPLAGMVRMCIRSPYVVAKRNDATHYDLTGEAFNLMKVTADQVFVFPDEVEITEGQELNDELRMNALPLEQFIRVTSEEALPEALGLLLRLAIADGRLTDAELLSIQPALEGRLWQPGLEVKVGDVYTYGAFLWRCLQDHITQGTWTPDLVPALWRKIEVISEDAVRVWVAGIDYIVGDEVAYPDANGAMYICQQAHTSQTGWEPHVTPALWLDKNSIENLPYEESGNKGLMNDEGQNEEA